MKGVSILFGIVSIKAPTDYLFSSAFLTDLEFVLPTNWPHIFPWNCLYLRHLLLKCDCGLDSAASPIVLTCSSELLLADLIKILIVMRQSHASWDSNFGASAIFFCLKISHGYYHESCMNTHVLQFLFLNHTSEHANL